MGHLPEASNIYGFVAVGAADSVSDKSAGQRYNE